MKKFEPDRSLPLHWAGICCPKRQSPRHQNRQQGDFYLAVRWCGLQTFHTALCFLALVGASTRGAGRTFRGVAVGRVAVRRIAVGCFCTSFGRAFRGSRGADETRLGDRGRRLRGSKRGSAGSGSSSGAAYFTLFGGLAGSRSGSTALGIGHNGATADRSNQ